MTVKPRLFSPPEGSFFLFGPRGTGKSTWLRATYPDALFVDCRSDAEFFFVGHAAGSVLVPWYDGPDWERNPHFVADKIASPIHQPPGLLGRCASGGHE